MSGTNGVPTNTVRLSGRTKGWPHWTTPENVLDVVREVGNIALDPCSNVASIVRADHEIRDAGTESNGLLADWSAANGLVFVNPPYNQAAAFIAKCVSEAAMGCEIIALVAARTDTRWAHKVFGSAGTLCFWGPGRIRFGNPPDGSDGDAPSIPSMLAYWGRNGRNFTAAFGKHGCCVDLRGGRKSFPVQVRP